MKINKNIKQFSVYLIVGGLATIVEWAAFYLLGNLLNIHYLTATALAFVVSTFANWLFGKWMLFKKSQGIFKELLKVYITSIAGLLFNLGIMWLAVEVCCFHKMTSKIIATVIVFFWNFLIRKLVIYKI